MYRIQQMTDKELAKLYPNPEDERMFDTPYGYVIVGNGGEYIVEASRNINGFKVFIREDQ